MPPFFWTQKQDVGPSGRTSHALAFDAAHKTVVLFGGDPGGSPLGDTWMWDGSLWTQVGDTGPDARHRSAAAFDAARGQVVLFGGAAGQGLFGDTWTWDGELWTQVADTGPAARAGHAVAYDAARQQVVLFGGRTGAGLVADTWAWDGSEWTQVQDAGPSARQGHAMADEPATGKVLLFGGAGGSGAGLDDTWAWDGLGWAQAADTGPDERVHTAMITTGTVVVLFGGVNSIDPLLSPADRVLYRDSWRWDGKAWTQVQDIGPGPRWGHGIAFRTDVSRILLFGGSSVLAPAEDSLLIPGLQHDTWEHSEPTSQPDDGQPNGGDPNAGPVAVASVTATPDTVSNQGDTMVVVATLTGPAPVDGVQLTIGVFVDTGGGGFMPVDPPGFIVPLTMGVDGGGISAQFTMVRDATPLAPGGYAVGVGVDAGQMQGALFTIT